MINDYYYTDKEELDALRVENAKLKQEVENLKKQVAINAVILPRGAGRTQKGGVKTNGNQEN